MSTSAEDYGGSLPHERAAEAAGIRRTMRPHWRRLESDVVDREWLEATHSLLNIPTEFSRHFPQLAGRLWFWQTVATIAAGFVWLASGLPLR